MNQIAERAFVKSEAGRFIEPSETRAAGRADAVLIERVFVNERRVAGGTEIAGLERCRRSETLVANGNACPFIQGPSADAAVVGKKQRKNAVRNPAEESGASRSRYATTREGAPPDIVPNSLRFWSANS